jgi:DNA-binding HxlR family transcriptional regulator
MGYRQLSLLIPYLSSHMTKSALRRLVKGGIPRTADLNESPFDHTHWYSFTAYGKRLMAVAYKDRQERP